jgi:hypothetical protein
MRATIFAAVATALLGCVHQPSAAISGVEVRLGSCIPAASPALLFTVINNSRERVSFRTYGASGPPYKLHPGALQLTSVPENEPWQVVLEHFVAPSHEVSLAPGDEAAFVAEPSVWPSPGHKGTFRVDVRDTRWRPHSSEDLRMCHPGSAPNSSSKPTPLRGAA